MKRALLILAALASPAFADQPRVCSCVTPHSLPATGAVDVPTNARFWRLPSDVPGQPIKPYELAPHTTFAVERISFTTGAGPDHEPPITPSVAGATISLLTNETNSVKRAPVSLLHVIAATSGDTAVVHLHIIDTQGEVDYYTTPDQLSVCEPIIEVAPGHLRLEVTALDLAGNESAPDTTEVDTTVDPIRPCGKVINDWHGSDHGAEDIVLAILFSLLGCGMLFARTRTRDATRANSAPASFALASVEHLARAVRMRSLVTLLLLGSAAGLALNDGDVRRWVAGASLFGVVLFIRAISSYIDAGSVMRLAHYEGADATVRFDEVAIAVGGQRRSVRASPQLVEHARRHALPKATL